MSIIVTCLWCDHTETGTGYAPHGCYCATGPHHHNACPRRTR